jgi:hypothetical protein
MLPKTKQNDILVSFFFLIVFLELIKCFINLKVKYFYRSIVFFFFLLLFLFLIQLDFKYNKIKQN